jgi:hypothetical protein
MLRYASYFWFFAHVFSSYFVVSPPIANFLPLLLFRCNRPGVAVDIGLSAHWQVAGVEWDVCTFHQTENISGAGIVTT